jgi:hypothetical protein
MTKPGTGPPSSGANCGTPASRAADSSGRLAMSCLGKLGRFGNQVMQYAFLRICAKQSGAAYECPTWDGQTLFGHVDPPVSGPLPPAIERSNPNISMFDVVPELIPWIEKIAGSKSSRVGPEALDRGLKEVDLWGFFQLHTGLLKPHQEFFRSLFRPVDDLKLAVEQGLNRLRAQGTTVIGLHIRRGDFLSLPLFGFTYPVPSRWWKEWLKQIWNTLDSPVLLICSDDLDDVVQEFQEYAPVTYRDMKVVLPERMKHLDFYVDFYLLSHCDVLGVGNSTFSFVASLLNEQGRKFVRPHWDLSSKFIEFDPWNSAPLLYYGGERPKLFKTFSNALEVSYATEGLTGLIQCSYAFPREVAKMKWNRALYGYRGAGVAGFAKSLVQPLRKFDS